MEDPRPTLSEALKEAMRNKDSQRRDVLRNLNSAIKQVEVDSRKELSAEDVVEILHREAKKRRESIEEMTGAGREDLAQVEAYELAVIEEFLPRQLTEEEVRAIVQEEIAAAGVSSPKEMGKVMGPVMARVKGLADGKFVNQVVREMLNS